MSFTLDKRLEKQYILDSVRLEILCLFGSDCLVMKCFKNGNYKIAIGNHGFGFGVYMISPELAGGACFLANAYRDKDNEAD